LSQAALETFARGYVTGFFDVVSAMLSKPVPNAVAAIGPCGSGDLAAYLEKFNAIVRVQIESGGAVAFLLSGGDANAIVAGALGEEAAADVSIAGRDPATLREVFEPCLGGGASFFKEKYGKVLVLKNAEALACGPDIAAGLLQLVGADGSAAEFSFSLGDGHDAAGVILFSSILRNVIPQAAPAQGGSTVAGPMSQDEANAMLSGVGPNADTEGAAAAPPPPKRDGPGGDSRNLDMVLDIRLTATARLGRIDMQITDILSLGPGSIIEVGHLVDEPVELLVNDKLIARGDVVVVDEKFGLRITEIVSPRERIESLR
jgi:flagellar motor switch protein FliN/FliY